MKKSLSRYLPALALTLALLMPAAAEQRAEGDDENHVVILHTNDTHSGILPMESGKNSGCGGYARREEYIKKVRSENKNVILLDAGDFSQGSPFFSLFKGDVEIELMNALGYDAATIGNHEFDNGQDELARRTGNAEFPLLCANYTFNKSNLNSLLKPYIIIERAGKKFGIIGLTVNVKNVVAKKFQDGMEYQNHIEVANALAERLRKEEGCNVIIALTHIGFREDIELAEQSKEIDIIVGGHSHTTIENKKVVKNLNGNDVIVVQDGEKGEFVGRLDIWL